MLQEIINDSEFLKSLKDNDNENNSDLFSRLDLQDDKLKLVFSLSLHF